MQSSENISCDEFHEDEHFKDIPGYIKRYQISNYGRVRSLKNGKSRILKPGKNNKGYLHVELCGNGKRGWLIHQLVAITFLNHQPCRMERVIDHIDNNILNNHISNLQITTQRENIKKRKDKATYSGVTYDARNKKFRVSIGINNKDIHFGRYENEIEASEVAEFVYKSLEDNKFIDCSKINGIQRNDIIYDLSWYE